MGYERDVVWRSYLFSSSMLLFQVFINLRTQQFFCLPDNYQVIDSSLSDIQRALDPVFTRPMVEALDYKAILSQVRLLCIVMITLFCRQGCHRQHFDTQDVFGVRYLPGFVGLNNLKHTDFVNVVSLSISTCCFRHAARLVHIVMVCALGRPSIDACERLTGFLFDSLFLLHRRIVQLYVAKRCVGSQPSSSPAPEQSITSALRIWAIRLGRARI